MNSKPKYAMQAGGMCNIWRSPDGNFKHSFLKLDFECDPDKHSGIVIVADEHYKHAFAVAVQNLQNELPSLLQRIRGKPIAYWWLENDQQEIKRILAGLSEHPLFADRR